MPTKRTLTRQLTDAQQQVKRLVDERDKALRAAGTGGFNTSYLARQLTDARDEAAALRQQLDARRPAAPDTEAWKRERSELRRQLRLSEEARASLDAQILQLGAINEKQAAASYHHGRRRRGPDGAPRRRPSRPAHPRARGARRRLPLLPRRATHPRRRPPRGRHRGLRRLRHPHPRTGGDPVTQLALTAPATARPLPVVIGLDIALVNSGVAGADWTDHIRTGALRDEARLDAILERAASFYRYADLVVLEAAAFSRGLNTGGDEMAASTSTGAASPPRSSTRSPARSTRPAPPAPATPSPAGC
jgi:hypothetical protein